MRKKKSYIEFVSDQTIVSSNTPYIYNTIPNEKKIIHIVSRNIELAKNGWAVG